MKDIKYLAIDVETGGIGHDKSLLTVYMTVLNNMFVKDCMAAHHLIELNLRIKPENGIYSVTAQGLSVNGIDLVEHDKDASTPSEVKSWVYDFLNYHSDKGSIKLVPLGHGVAFDLKFITESKDALISKATLDQFVSYRVMDTATIGQFLKVAGKVPHDISGSLSSWADHFGIDSSNAHDAKADVEMSVKVMKKMLDLIK